MVRGRAIVVWARALLVALPSFVCPAAAEIILHGRVVDENQAPVAGAQITVSQAGAASQRVLSDPTGAFVVPLPALGEYRIRAEREGHFQLEQTVEVQEDESELTLTLPYQRERVESLDVSYSPPAVDPERTHVRTTLSGTELLDVPYPKTNELRNSLRLLPGVVQDARGGIHINGGTEEQVLYTLDGFTVNDPLSGRLETRVSVEAVRAFELTSGSLPAEYGKGASAVLTVRSDSGDDKMRYAATNFVPGIEHHKGLVIGGWTPRFGVSGPIKRGRAWFSDSLDLQYNNTVVDELPPGADQSTSWRGSNLLRGQFSLTPANTLSTGLLTTFWTARRTGLSAIDPLETTADRRARSYLFHARDQIAFTKGALVEFGYAGTRTFGREIPQGFEPQIFTPFGLRGNYGNDARREGARDQAVLNSFLPAFTAAGRHQIKAGIDLHHVTYEQDVWRSGIDFQRTDGKVVRSTRFLGSGAFRRGSVEASSYVQDSWRVGAGLVLELGLRQDWDALVRDVSVAPRLGAAWSLAERSKIAAGFASVYEPPNLRLFTQPLDQYGVTTLSMRDDPLVVVSTYAIRRDALRTPRYDSANLTFEHQFGPRLYLRTAYIRRRGMNGFSYDLTGEVGEAAGSGLFPASWRVAEHWLTNLRRDVFDSGEIQVRQSIGSRYEWMASYTRSRALSNAVMNLSIDNPLFFSNNVGRMPWDTPNRIVSWAYLPLPWKKWAAAYFLEWRSGQPYSIQDEEGTILGDINGYRFPEFFELNLHFERRFTALKYRWAFRFGGNNITNHRNPNVVINTMGSPQFLRFYGGQHRALNFRIRWLGKA